MLHAQHRPFRPMAEVSFLQYAEYKEKRPLLAGKHSGKSQGKTVSFFKVREKSVNCASIQKNSKFHQKVGVKSEKIYFWLATRFVKKFSAFNKGNVVSKNF